MTLLPEQTMTLLTEHVCSVWRNYEYSGYNLCQAYLIELSHVKRNDAGGIFRNIFYMRVNHETFLRINTHTLTRKAIQQSL